MTRSPQTNKSKINDYTIEKLYFEVNRGIKTTPPRITLKTSLYFQLFDYLRRKIQDNNNKIERLGLSIDQ